MIQIAADQHQLVFARIRPIGVIDREAFPCQVEDVSALAFLKPENSFGAKDFLGSWLSRKFWNLRSDKGSSLWKDSEVNPSMAR